MNQTAPTLADLLAVLDRLKSARTDADRVYDAYRNANPGPANEQHREAARTALAAACQSVRSEYEQACVALTGAAGEAAVAVAAIEAGYREAARAERAERAAARAAK